MNLLLLLACSDYNIDADGKDPKGFDGGGTDSVPVDTDDTDETGDSADTAPTCPDRSYPGQEIGTEDCEVTGASVAWELEEVWSVARTGAGDGTLSGAVVVNLADDDGDGTIGDPDDVADVVVADGQFNVYAFDGSATLRSSSRGATASSHWTARGTHSGSEPGACHPRTPSSSG